MRKNKWGMTPADAAITEIVFGTLFKVFAYGMAVLLAPFFYFYLLMFVLRMIKMHVESGIPVQ